MVVMSGGEGLLEPVGKVPGAAEHATMDRITSTTHCVGPNVSCAKAEEHLPGPSQQCLIILTVTEPFSIANIFSSYLLLSSHY